jgi:hypothetical protein
MGNKDVYGWFKQSRLVLGGLLELRLKELLKLFSKSRALIPRALGCVYAN